VPFHLARRRVPIVVAVAVVSGVLMIAGCGSSSKPSSPSKSAPNLIVSEPSPGPDQQRSPSQLPPDRTPRGVDGAWDATDGPRDPGITETLSVPRLSHLSLGSRATSQRVVGVNATARFGSEQSSTARLWGTLGVCLARPGPVQMSMPSWWIRAA
jgi:hypothetical protein